jgi:glycerol kinase
MYIIALDQGTTSSRAIVVNQQGRIIGTAQQEFPQHFPQPGWVEHDPELILRSQIEVLIQVLDETIVDRDQVLGIGITNQRETTIIWDRTTGKPIYNAIVWQDKRTASICEKLKRDGLEEYVKGKTGLVIDSYFSATKIKWILDHVPGARDRAKKGELAFGTVDTWLIWNLTKGKVHATDVTNASRTMLFDIHTLQWDQRLLNELDIPIELLPEVRSCTAGFGEAQLDSRTIPICAVAGDQQAALFGQACFEPGMAKNTYGTGCFMLMNIGEQFRTSKSGLLTTLAWQLDGKTEYAFEGSVFMAGAAVQWLRDGLRIIEQSKDSEYFANTVAGSYEVYVVPAFVGLGAPYWDMYARGAIFGLTRDTGKEHIIKATLEAIAYQTKDILLAMEQDSGLKLKRLNVDGGACANNLLMQFQADMLGCEVERPIQIESTALGAAYMAGLASGLWTMSDIRGMRTVDRVFKPMMDDSQRNRLYESWKKAVERTLGWARE